MKFAKIFAAAALLAATGAASAAAASSDFSVSVSLSPICNVKTAATNINFGTYTPFTNGAINDTSSSVVFQCSQGIAPTTVGFTRVSGIAADMTSSPHAATSATAVGVLSGLRYTLSIPALGSPSAAGTAASAGTASVGGNNSTAKEYTFGITANMPGNQAGGTGGDTSQTWQVVLTY